MKKILAPVDFSNQASGAAHYAAAIAKELNASLTLLYVFNLPIPVSEAPFPVDFSNLNEENSGMLKQYAKELERKYGIVSDLFIRPGFAVDEILEFSAEGNYDLIVMGSRGSGGVISDWMGSTATGVLRNSNIPILVIPSGSVFSPWDHILLAFDFTSVKDSTLFDELRSLSNCFHSEIAVLHIVEEGEVDEKEKELAVAKAESYLENTRHKYHWVTNTNVQAGLQSYLQAHPADLMVIVPHEHNWLDRLFFQNHSENLMLHTTIPLLALPDARGKGDK
jgi:nucleotide-binding universal stress UspA family protein